MRLKVNCSHFNNENFCKDTKTFFLYALFAARNVYFVLFNMIKAEQTEAKKMYLHSSQKAVANIGYRLLVVR